MEKETALKILREVHDDGLFSVRTALETLIPELKESEDERISREITEFLVDFNNGEYENPNENTIDSWLSWLEKQGKQKSSTIEMESVEESLGVDSKTCNKIVDGEQKLARWNEEDENEYAHILKTLNLVAKEQETKGYNNLISSIKWLKSLKAKCKGATESTVELDKKVEPKLKVGDWIVTNTNNSGDIFLIQNTNNGHCTLEDVKGNIIFPCLPPCENESHLWAVEDAKNGDILAIGSTCFLFKGKKENTSPIVNTTYCFAHSSENGIRACPATKEQRDFFFQKMKEVGYEWDVEKKELRKLNNI